MLQTHNFLINMFSLCDSLGLRGQGGLGWVDAPYSRGCDGPIAYPRVPGGRPERGPNLPFSIAEITMMPVESALETMRNSTVCPGRTPSPTLTENFYRAASKRGPNRSDPTAASTISYAYSCRKEQYLTSSAPQLIR